MHEQVAGRRDFTRDEWATMQRAMMASGVLVALAEGIVEADEVHALTKELRSARFAHRSDFIRELADVPSLNTRRPLDTTYASLETIRSAAGLLASKAPGELPAFRALLVQLAEVVADAHREGDIFGVGAQSRTPNEAAAIEDVKRALDV